MKHFRSKFSAAFAAAALATALNGAALSGAALSGAALSGALLSSVLMSAAAYADDAVAAKGAPANIPAPTKHQLMKECMAKERAAISGRETYDLTADCRNITKTEKQNADAKKKAEDTERNKGG